MRIVSFLPSATEIVYALGLGDRLAGVTHECDYPPEVKSKPVVVRSTIQMKGMTSQQIDATVSRTLRAGESLYTVDEVLLNQLAPDLILTQDLCQVCAPSGHEIERVLPFLQRSPNILYLTPTCLADIFDNIRQVGDATDRTAEADALVRQLEKRVEAVTSQTRTLFPCPRVFCLEWLRPLYNAGHWMPELVELAGGIDGLGQKGKNSIRVAWEQIVDYSPEVLILSPCGLNLAEVIGQAHLLTTYSGWERLPAVKRGLVYAVDADSYFARPGPRVVAGLELLAHLLHPDRFPWLGSADAYQTLNAEEIRFSARQS